MNASTGAPGGTPTSATAPFERLLGEYYPAWFRYHPEAAVDAGVPGYERRLTPYRDEDRGALVSLNDNLVSALDEFDTGALPPPARTDAEVLRQAARLENRRLIELDSRRTDPGELLPVHAIYQLLIRPVAERGAALAARLAAIPDHLAGAPAHLAPRAESIPPLWLEHAATEARQGAGFIAALPADASVAAAGVSGLDALIAGARSALLAFADHLEGELAPRARGDFACGRAYFDDLLAHRHFLGVDADGLRVFGERLFAETRRELQAVCRELSGGDDVAALGRRIQADHPDENGLLAAYRGKMEAAREFLAARELVSLPAVTRLDVVETPTFLRHRIPFAAYSEPAPNDPAQHGRYYVTPPRDAAELAEHDHLGLAHTCVHEAWPGHHLQFVTANLSPVGRTLPRLLNPSATFYEGWALYCEQLMHEQGFLDRPQNRFILLKDRLWRALRILIDVDIHTRGLGLEAAADRMVAELGFPRAQALADLAWYSAAPTVPMGYATGWALINALRERLQRRDPGFSLKSFHDRLLSHGSIALPLVIRHAFGDADWQAVREAVFGPP